MYQNCKIFGKTSKIGTIFILFWFVLCSIFESSEICANLTYALELSGWRFFLLTIWQGFEKYPQKCLLYKNKYVYLWRNLSKNQKYDL